MEIQENGLKDAVFDYWHMTLDSKLCVMEAGLNTMTSMEGRVNSFPILSPVD